MLVKTGKRLRKVVCLSGVVVGLCQAMLGLSLLNQGGPHTVGWLAIIMAVANVGLCLTLLGHHSVHIRTNRKPAVVGCFASAVLVNLIGVGILLFNVNMSCGEFMWRILLFNGRQGRDHVVAALFYLTVSLSSLLVSALATYLLIDVESIYFGGGVKSPPASPTLPARSDTKKTSPDGDVVDKSVRPHDDDDTLLSGEPTVVLQMTARSAGTSRCPVAADAPAARSAADKQNDRDHRVEIEAIPSSSLPADQELDASPNHDNGSFCSALSSGSETGEGHAKTHLRGNNGNSSSSSNDTLTGTPVIVSGCFKATKDRANAADDSHGRSVQAEFPTAHPSNTTRESVMRLSVFDESRIASDTTPTTVMKRTDSVARKSSLKSSQKTQARCESTHYTDWEANLGEPKHASTPMGHHQSMYVLPVPPPPPPLLPGGSRPLSDRSLGAVDSLTTPHKTARQLESDQAHHPLATAFPSAGQRSSRDRHHGRKVPMTNPTMMAATRSPPADQPASPVGLPNVLLHEVKGFDRSQFRKSPRRPSTALERTSRLLSESSSGGADTS